MGVLNLAHGSMYMIGAYIAFTVTNSFIPSFWLALIIAPIVVGLISLIIEVVLLRTTYQLGHLSQVLMTFGLAYIFHDLARWIWGSNPLSVKPPEVLSGSIELFDQTFGLYRLAVIDIGIIIVIVVWFMQEKTRWGAIIHA